MRILLAHNSTYYPAHGGGDKSNRLLMESLASLGHSVRVFTRLASFDVAARQTFLAELAQRGVKAEALDNGEVRFHLNGVEVFAVATNPRLRPAFSAHIEEFDPGIIITSTDDPAQLLFDVAIRAPRARVVYLIRATIAVPFGPDSAGVNAAKTESLRNADAVVGVSHYVANYGCEYGGLDAVHVPISLLEGRRQFLDLGAFDNRYVSMVNPCAVKGIDIFLALADAMPQLEFAAIPTWGATAAELDALRLRSNITLLPPVDDIDELLRLSRIVLVPSVWAEARSRIVLEAMSRGVPVIASDVGGLHEAKLDVPYLLPVNPVRSYHASLDASMVPVAEVPPQDVAPWIAVLQRLTTDSGHWSEIAAASRKAALDYAEHLTAEPFAKLLEEVARRPVRARTYAKTTALSDEKRKLLALRLKQRVSSPWFPGIEEKTGLPKLFCFPWAGAGTAGYLGWVQPLRAVAQVCPVRLPGRESRSEETPVEDFDDLLQQLASAIQPYLETPFHFFGHSMGAGIAFELACRLTRQPLTLHVSSARSPLLRTESLPALSESQFREELRRIEAPRAAEHVLAADARLYRGYVHRPGPPLSVPIHAYGGEQDHVTPDQLRAWSGITNAAFTLDLLPGGHLYIESQRAALCALLSKRITSRPH